MRYFFNFIVLGLFSILLISCGSSDSNLDNSSDTNNSTLNNQNTNNQTVNKPIIEQLNTLRTNSGLISLSTNSLLNISSLNHAKYLDINNISSHTEITTNASFTGEQPVNRAIFVGYKSKKVLENLSTGQETKDLSLDGLMSAIYHRFGFLNFEINEIGYGEQNRSYVYNMGNKNLNNLCNGNSYTGINQYAYNVCSDSNFRIEKSVYENAINTVINSNPSNIKYPYSNQTDVTPVFFEEVPDPLPTYGVSGYPISIEFNKNDFNMSNFTISRFILKDANSNIIPLIEYNDSSNILKKTNDVNSKISKYQFVIFPSSRLAYNSTYSVEFSYIYNGNSSDLIWSFRTKNLVNLINYQNAALNLNLDTNYYIYLEPINKNDVLTNTSITCSYLQGGSAIPTVSFYDKNTIKIKVSGSKVQQCTLRVNGNVTVNKDITININ